MTVEIPWFMKSPSPWTLIMWLILAIWASRILINRVNYRRPRLAWLLAFVDSALILGFLVLLTDLFWCVACGLRFGADFPFYPDVYGLILSAARDGVGMVFLGLFVWDNFKQQIIGFSKLTYAALAGYALFLAAWFCLAPDLSFVDWNYAFKYGYPSARVLQDFLVSHVLSRSFIVVLYYSVFRRPSRPGLSAAVNPGLGAQKAQIFLWAQNKRKGSAAGRHGFFIMPALDKKPVGGCINYLQAEIVQDGGQDPDGQNPGPETEKGGG